MAEGSKPSADAQIAALAAGLQDELAQRMVQALGSTAALDADPDQVAADLLPLTAPLWVVGADLVGRVGLDGGFRADPAGTSLEDERDPFDSPPVLGDGLPMARSASLPVEQARIEPDRVDAEGPDRAEVMPWDGSSAAEQLDLDGAGAPGDWGRPIGAMRG